MSGGAGNGVNPLCRSSAMERVIASFGPGAGAVVGGAAGFVDTDDGWVWLREPGDEVEDLAGGWWLWHGVRMRPLGRHRATGRVVVQIVGGDGVPPPGGEGPEGLIFAATSDGLRTLAADLVAIADAFEVTA